jgi:hypothetical protein
MTSSTPATAALPAISISSTMPATRSIPSQHIVGRDRYKKMSHELRIASPADKRLRLVAGLFYQRQTHGIHQDYQVTNLADALSVNGHPGTLWLTEQKRVDRDYAAFGEASFDITDAITLTGGLRGYKYRQWADRLLRLRPQSGRRLHRRSVQRRRKLADRLHPVLHHHRRPASRQHHRNRHRPDRSGLALHQSRRFVDGKIVPRQTKGRRHHPPAQPQLEDHPRPSGLRDLVARASARAASTAAARCRPMTRTRSPITSSASRPNGRDG